MKILLINNNPVVSRLTALSARKEDIEIDEIQEVTELSSDTYDIVFVDADSWTKDVRDVISDNIKTQKSVLFYAEGDEKEKASFDLSILKPFLPSEVSAVIRSIEESADTTEKIIDDVNHFDIIADAKETDRDDLFSLDGLDDLEEIKEVSFDDKLEEAFPLKINTLDDDLFENEPKLDLDIKEEEDIAPSPVVSNENNDLDNDLFDLDLSDEVPSLDDNLFDEVKKDEPLELMDELELEFDDKEINEPVNKIEIKEEEIKKETQVLDESEIENIKGILTEDIDNDMTLEDLMPAIPSTGLSQEVKEDKVDEGIEIDSADLVQTLAAMPVQNLRELLAGAQVNIKIKFPKQKK